MKTIKTSLHILWLVFILLLVAALYSVILTVVARAQNYDPWQEDYIELDRISKVETPSITPLECDIERVVPVETLLSIINLGNGLESYMFSTDGDKKPDFEMLIPEGDENRYPLFYRVDRDYDGFIDIVYIDDRRDGSCAGVRVYWLPKKQPSTKPPTNRHQGDPIPDGESCEGMTEKEARE